MERVQISIFSWKTEYRVFGITVEPLYKGHHWEPILDSKVSLTQGLPVHNWAVLHNIKLLTVAAVVGNLLKRSMSVHYFRVV